MAALSAARNTRRFGPDEGIRLSIPVADNVKFYPGALVVIAAGYAAPATAATGKFAVGRCESDSILDNTVTGHAAAAFNVPVRTGAFLWDIKSGDEVAQADVGTVVWVEDDHTVRKTSASSSAAGVLLAIEGTQAVVYTNPAFRQT